MNTIARQPNILFIMVDQLGAATLDLYGGEVPSTPTLRRWAETGLRFTRCYATVAVCAPNRATILTGRSPVAHGVTANNLELDLRTPTYTQALKTVGYRLGGFGKFHQTTMALPLPKDMNFLGFDESVPTEDPRLGPWLEWVATAHPEHYEAALATCWPMPYLSNAERAAWQKAYDRYLAPRRQTSRWSLMYPSPLPLEVQQTTWITDLGINFIQRHCETYPEQPFFCHLSYVDPHDPYDPPEPYANLFHPDAMPDPLPAGWLEHTPKALLKKQRFAGFDRITNDKWALKQLQAYYHGSLRFIDDQLARIENFLKTRGLWETTLVVFTSDHGEMLGDHGLITKGVTHYDKGIRCPLVVRGPGIMPDSLSDRLVCSLDFFPTFCDWAGLKRRPLLEGKSFAGACQGDESESWESITVESDHCPDVHPSVRSIITTDGWRLTIFDEDSGYGEMFDLNSDPQERRNLYFDAAFAEQKTTLFEQHVRAYMRSSQVQQRRNLPVKDGRPQRIVQGLILDSDVL